MNPIEIILLSKTFRGRRKQFVKALTELNLTVAEGEVFGFLGPNGAGKSTTIKTLMGQISPSSGAALLFGRPAGPPVARLNVGYLPENPAFYDFLTASEYLDLVGRVFGMQKSTIRLESERVLELFDLVEAAKRPIKGYSKGMVQRLGLAQALLHDPDLYILDEPMSGLDPVGRALVKQIMIDLKGKGKTIFFSTHVIADVEAVCDRVGIIAQGQLKAENSVEEILEQGIEGYSIRLVEPVPNELNQYLPEDATADHRELYVPRKDFTHVIGQLEACGCLVSNVEPNRKSLEDFFLKVIDSPETL
jgi:ABC-2 type transport system ATP-binding protein